MFFMTFLLAFPLVANSFFYYIDHLLRIDHLFMFGILSLFTSSPLLFELALHTGIAFAYRHRSLVASLRASLSLWRSATAHRLFIRRIGAAVYAHHQHTVVATAFQHWSLLVRQRTVKRNTLADCARRHTMLKCVRAFRAWLRAYAMRRRLADFWQTRVRRAAWAQWRTARYRGAEGGGSGKNLGDFIFDSVFTSQNFMMNNFHIRVVVVMFA